jgi:hypothetical protein
MGLKFYHFRNGKLIFPGNWPAESADRFSQMNADFFCGDQRYSNQRILREYSSYYNKLHFPTKPLKSAIFQTKIPTPPTPRGGGTLNLN